jgi:hypothetical protein
MLGGSSVEIAGHRAVAQTKMTISQRAKVEDVLCDVVCIGRLYDFFEKREERWGLVLRQPIYEKDRLDPVDPTAAPLLDRELLARFPEGYRHLAYLQMRIGYTVKPDMPGSVGPELNALYVRGDGGLGVGLCRRQQVSLASRYNPRSAECLTRSDLPSRNSGSSAIEPNTTSAIGASDSRVPVPESTPTASPAPAARAISRSWRLSPTMAISEGFSPVRSEKAMIVSGAGLGLATASYP